MCLNKIVRHPFYVFAVIFIISPMQGVIFQRGGTKTALILLVCNVPWFLFHLLPVLKIYKASEERGIKIDDLTG